MRLSDIANVGILFAHIKHILRLDQLRLSGPNGVRDEIHLAEASAEQKNADYRTA